MRKWYESEESNRDVIIGGQICLVRNIQGYPFEDKMSREQQQTLLQTVCDGIGEVEAALSMDFHFLSLPALKGYEQKALVGRLAVPPHMLAAGHETGLLLSEDESVSILINGREHLCIQVSCGGSHIQEAMRTARLVDNSLNRYLPYAFSKKYGYLTASPLFTGTGLSASYLLHLPYLEKKQLIGKLEKGLGQYGFSLRAHFQGQTQAPGSIYRVKNRKTLGLSESEILSALEHLTGQLAGQERKLTEQIFHGDRLQEEDQMYRAYGLLRYAKDLSYDETMEYLSIVHIGDRLGVWPEGRQMASFAMMVNVADAVLSADANMNIGGSERGGARAAYMQKYLPWLGDISQEARASE